MTHLDIPDGEAAMNGSEDKPMRPECARLAKQQERKFPAEGYGPTISIDGVTYQHMGYNEVGFPVYRVKFLPEDLR